MAELIWTDKAVTSLEDIYDYIAKDSPRYARYQISSIFLTILLIFFFMGCETAKESLSRPPSAGPVVKSAPGSDITYIDTHNHLFGGIGCAFGLSRGGTKRLGEYG